jgi:hypothetical protein
MQLIHPSHDMDLSASDEFECKACWFCVCHNTPELSLPCEPANIKPVWSRRLVDERWLHIYASVREDQIDPGHTKFRLENYDPWLDSQVSVSENVLDTDLVESPDLYSTTLNRLVSLMETLYPKEYNE